MKHVWFPTGTEHVHHEEKPLLKPTVALELLAPLFKEEKVRDFTFKADSALITSC